MNIRQELEKIIYERHVPLIHAARAAEVNPVTIRNILRLKEKKINLKTEYLLIKFIRGYYERQQELGRI